MLSFLSGFVRSVSFLCVSIDIYANNTGEGVDLPIIYRYFKEFEQPASWKEQGYDQYSQFNYRLRYILPHSQRKRFEFRDIYLAYSMGRQLAHAADDNRMIIGITLQ